jgi:hypothetical protein
MPDKKAYSPIVGKTHSQTRIYEAEIVGRKTLRLSPQSGEEDLSIEKPRPVFQAVQFSSELINSLIDCIKAI